MKSIVAGNWKMFGSKQRVDLLVNELLAGLDDAVTAQVDVLVCPPSIYLERVASQLLPSSVKVAGQNICAESLDEGAYTGEISATMLKDQQCSHVLVGHSERRSYYAETDLSVAEKTQHAMNQGLIPIVCIGETLAQRDASETMKTLEVQLTTVLDRLTEDKPIIIAYEPVWAIGTGLSATPEQAQEVHCYIRSILKQHAKQDSAILYGGSVKPNTTAELIKQDDIDGVLVGGASLLSEDFLEIIRNTI